MGDKPMKLGSITLLMLIVFLCMAILSTLTLATAIADLKLAQKYGAHVQRVYAMNGLGEHLLLKVDEAMEKGQTKNEILALLPENAVINDDIITTSLSDGSGQMLNIVLRLNAKDISVLEWKSSVEWSYEDEFIEGLWGTK